jgi:hypothetical protein
MRKSTFAPLALVTALTLALSACVVEETPIENENPEPSEPALTVQGVDADKDGLRDDVQTYLHDTYSNSASNAPALAASIQLAKAFQLLVVTGTDASHALTAGAAMNRAIDCLYSIDPEKFGSRVDDVEGAVVNTGDRAQAYARAGAFLSGGTYNVSTVANNAASCEVAP